ncbi:peptidoglycan bridge formation glycyltransferase FemA/FemB family protein, partial [Patescibacteria group bacterium]|nr:peptidoglycan bridge formation glycyltransferase FemA/FemB family protein [Patescibacteria group bacterium]
IKKLEDKSQLDQFIAGQPNSQFLQSWHWGEFKQVQTKRLLRIGVFDQGKLLGAATAICIQLQLSRCYVYCPRGPVVDDSLSDSDKEEVWGNLFYELKSWAKEQDAMFLRVEPTFRIDLEKFGFSKTKTIQPKDTLFLDLSKPEETLLQEMKQKTRYNIRLAEKRGVKIQEDCQQQSIATFCDLLGKTKDRDNFRPHPSSYYQTMMGTLNDCGVIKLFLASYQDKIIAANLTSWFGDTVTYLHGASDYQQRNLMAPHLLQWQVIKWAKAVGYHYYDFWGIADTDDPAHSWAGITRFKKGFGGFQESYQGTWEYSISPLWHTLYNVIKRIK